ncbi:MAG: hypothetical protein R2827_01790 [Bdellovibrionales bacterium]
MAKELDHKVFGRAEAFETEQEEADLEDAVEAKSETVETSIEEPNDQESSEILLEENTDVSPEMEPATPPSIVVSENGGAHV